MSNSFISPSLLEILNIIENEKVEKLSKEKLFEYQSKIGIGRNETIGFENGKRLDAAFNKIKSIIKNKK